MTGAGNGCGMGKNGGVFLEGTLSIQEDLGLYQTKGLCPRSREKRYKLFKVWAGK